MPSKPNQVSSQPFGTNPVDLSLSLGGALPFDWVLYDYHSADQGQTWSQTKLGAGRDDTVYRVPSLAQFAGHTLVWSVAAVYLDPNPLTVNVTASFRPVQPGPQEQDVKNQWNVTADKPNVYVSVEVT